MDLKTFRCYACDSGHKTIVDVETTANKISKENTIKWLLKNEGKIKEPFNKRSLFSTVIGVDGGLGDFNEKVGLFPKVTTVTLDGKLIRNLPALTDELKSWISSRKTEQGTCSLCFDSKRKGDLMLACGRTGCTQRICRDCLNGWYGLNKAGKILNFAALKCPFCRRAPTAATLSKYGMGVHAVAELKKAVEEQGTWISAWCFDCGGFHQKSFLSLFRNMKIILVNRTCETVCRARLCGWCTG